MSVDGIPMQSKITRQIAMERLLCTSAIPALILSTLVFAACKAPLEDRNAKTTSAEALVSADETKRVPWPCGPSGVKDETNEQLRDRVWLAAPPKLRAEFSNAAEFVRLSPDIKGTCGALLEKEVDPVRRERLNARIAGIGGCWIAESGRPVVWLAMNRAAINGGALAQMAYGFSEFYIDGIGGKLSSAASLAEGSEEPDATPSASQSTGAPGSDDATESYTRFVNGFVGLRTELGKALVEDLKAGSRTSTIDAYTAGFGKAVDALPGDRAFQNFAFAEMFDAWYCTKNSRDDLTTAGLTRSGQAFAPFAEYFGKAWWE